MTTVADLFRYEKLARFHARRLRLEWPDRPADAEEVRAYAAGQRRDADDFDMIGNLLAGLQGCDVDTVLPLLREGYLRLQAEVDRE